MIRRSPTRRRGLIALFGVLLAPLPDLAGQTVTHSALKAAFLYNVAKFAQWPDDQRGANAITLCVIDDSAVDDALDQLSRGGAINGRPVTMLRGSHERLRLCHLLYVGGTDVSRALAILEDIQGAPVLTVSDGEQFPRMGGMIGLFLDDGKMRFAVNPEAAQRCGIHLSSRLLSLAKLVTEHRYAQP